MAVAIGKAPFPAQTVARRVLNTGSGPRTIGRLHQAFASDDWQEVRLDLNPAVEPDLVGSIGNMRGLVQDASFDAIWCSHNVEHLNAFEVVPALLEFRRILKPSGFVLITCPDLEAICRIVIERGLTAHVYTSAAGPITPLDMIFGHGRSIAEGNKFMRHNCGFTEETLGMAALQAGFFEARVAKGEHLDLWAMLLMPGAERARIAATFEGTAEKFLLDG